MKLWIGSEPGAVHVLRPVGHSKAGDASAGVSAMKSPSPLQPPWNVWYRFSQCPISWVAVSPPL